MRRLVWSGLCVLLAHGCGGGSEDASNGGAPGMPSAAGSGGTGAPIVNAECVLTSSEVRVTDAAGDSLMAKVLADGDGYRLLWSDARAGAADVYSRRLTGGGAPDGAEAPVATTPATSTRPTAVEVGKGAWLAAWDEIAGDDLSVLAGPLGGPGNPGAVARGHQQARPGLALVAGTPVIAWMTLSKADPNAATVSVAKLTTAGALQGAPVAVGADAPARYPAIATNGSQIAVAYVAGAGRIKVALLDGALAVTREVVARDLPTDASNPAIAWDGKSWVVAWEDLRGGPDESVYATRIGADGSVAEPQAVSTAADGSSNWPQIAIGGDGTALVAFYAFPNDAEIMVRPLDAQGAPRGTASVRVSQSSGKARFPSVAYLPGAGEFGVAWNDNRDGNAEIYFVRLRCAPQ